MLTVTERPTLRRTGRKEPWERGCGKKAKILADNRKSHNPIETLYHVLPSEREELCKKGERVFRVRDGKYRSRAHSKREKRKQNKAWQRRKWEEGLKNENFRVPEREELPQDMTRGEDSWTRTTEDARRGRGE